MIDLNLIRAFVTIYETGSVSAAADRLHVSQPSISYTLKRLRDLLGEPLFKRTREGMAPTYFATQLYEKFRNAVSEIEGAIESTRKFDPYRRRFRLATSDIGEISLLPHRASQGCSPSSWISQARTLYQTNAHRKRRMTPPVKRP